MPRETSEITERISLAGIDAANLLGAGDANLKLIQHSFGAKMTARGDEIILRGQPQDLALLTNLILRLREKVESGAVLSERDIAYAIDDLQSRPTGGREHHPGLSSLKKLVKPKSPGQQEYLEAVQEYDLVIAIGPAGTGKTYLAVAAAVAVLNQRQVERVILCRPAVEAGESLGFLPGDFKEKIDPYMRPLYDALYDMMSPDKVNRFLANDVIEIVPLAYMRGRTLNNSFVILDEAQNATKTQMKMFLTRLGFNSKAVITGDVTQIDLARSESSGLIDARNVLQGVEGIRFVDLGEKDVVRHRLVQRIIQAYQGQPGSGSPEARPEGGPAD